MDTAESAVVLGGGIAGLSAAYFLTRRSIRPTVYEAAGVLGGNCRTIQVGRFRFDSGAHRIHGKDPEVTRHIFNVMGDRLKRVRAPSKIFDEGRLLSFPLEPRDVFSTMDARFTMKAGIDLLRSRLAKQGPGEEGDAGDFESFAIRSYGKTMARRYLLNYSQKLWGLPCDHLAADIAGERLKRINLGTLLLGMVSKRSAAKVHYEGEFYYPERGIGCLSEAMAEAIGNDNIKLARKVTSIWHDKDLITGIELNDREVVAPTHVVTTLPITDFVRMMRPAPPSEVAACARGLTFRHIRLAVFFLRGERVNTAATMYFPADTFMFTRGYEPKNRCATLAPGEMTSFVAEVPCYDGDWSWRAEPSEFLARVWAQIESTGLFRGNELVGSTDERIVNAYPVLRKDYTASLSTIVAYLSRFSNLEISGRNGLFRYLWIHDLVREGRNIATRIAERS